MNKNAIFQVFKTVRQRDLHVITTTHAEPCAPKGNMCTQESGQTSI